MATLIDEPYPLHFRLETKPGRTPPRRSRSAYVRWFARLTGLPVSGCDPATFALLDQPLSRVCPVLPASVADLVIHPEQPLVVHDPDCGLLFYVLELPWPGDDALLVAGFLPESPRAPSAFLLQAARSASWSPARLQQWLATLEPTSPAPLERLLLLARDRLAADDQQWQFRNDMELAIIELESSYEELTLLHDLSRDLHESFHPEELAGACLHRLRESSRADACGVLFLDSHSTDSKDSGDGPASHGPRQQWIGDSRIDDDHLEDLLHSLRAAAAGMPHAGQPIVQNHASRLPAVLAAAGWRHLIAVEIHDGKDSAGWILALNGSGQCDFGTVEASLLNSAAMMLSAHVRTARLLAEQEKQSLGFVRSLVSTLDAKDPYTRGHSQRVALVARHLARQRQLPERDVESIYLAGLLHDIGKIGIEDAILRKPGELTDAECQTLQLHPVIGAGILEGVDGLQHVVPGVRHHHENFNGSGYPDGLRGTEIPLMARIIAVADTYDAICSSRPYRNARSAEFVHSLFRADGAQQWDASVVRDYFAAADEIRTHWEQAFSEAVPQPLPLTGGRGSRDALPCLRD